MAKPANFKFDTLSLHAGQQPDPTTGSRATPIYQSASFVFKDTDFAVGLFNIERAGHVYSRLSNPTNAVLEERIATLDNGIGAVATSSGQAALHLALATSAVLNGGYIIEPSLIKKDQQHELKNKIFSDDTSEKMRYLFSKVVTEGTASTAFGSVSYTHLTLPTSDLV